jgi:hypothetical protein
VAKRMRRGGQPKVMAHLLLSPQEGQSHASLASSRTGTSALTHSSQGAAN